MSENIQAREDTAAAYELRPITFEDVFLMTSILSKIGFKEVKECFSGDAVKKALSEFIKDKGKDAPKSSESIEAVGISVAFDIAGLILKNLSSCKNELFQLLAGLSGMSTKEIAALPPATALQMIIDTLKQERFGDFFTVAVSFMK